MSVDSKYPWVKLSPFLILATPTLGCLMPPASVVQRVQAKENSADTASAKNIGDVPAPSKPTGVLISDGTVPTVMNLHPGGGWFVFNDHTPGGMMTPATNDDF